MRWKIWNNTEYDDIGEVIGNTTNANIDVVIFTLDSVYADAGVNGEIYDQTLELGFTDILEWLYEKGMDIQDANFSYLISRVDVNVLNWLEKHDVLPTIGISRILILLQILML